MSQTFLLSLDEAEFKVYLKDALRETLREVSGERGQNEPEIFTVTEAAAFLRIKVSTLYEKTAN
ncbi:MAG: hypothetical protein ACOYXT_18960, partial [Bacteroidota bacterium]